MPNPHEVEAQYLERLTEVEAEMGKLEWHIQGYRDSGRATWAIVGDLTRIRNLLRRINGDERA